MSVSKQKQKNSTLHSNENVDSEKERKWSEGKRSIVQEGDKAAASTSEFQTGSDDSISRKVRKLRRLTKGDATVINSPGQKQEERDRAQPKQEVEAKSSRHSRPKKEVKKM